MIFNLGELYHTRNGKSVVLSGVSEYREFVDHGPSVRLLTGKIDGETFTWNGSGDLMVSRQFLYEDFNDLDLLYSSPKVENPQVYYVEFRNKK